jgi:hypothetical protein
MITSTLTRYRELTRSAGLAAGLAAVLDGIAPAIATPRGLAILPTGQVPAEATVLFHPFAAREGLVLVRMPDRGGSGLPARHCAALAAVRSELLAGMLALAVRRLSERTFAGTPLIGQQLVVGQIADVVAGLEVLDEALLAVDGDTGPATLVALHEQLGELGWQVIQFFGAEGYIADHPVRALHLSALVADVWVVGEEYR